MKAAAGLTQRGWALLAVAVAFAGGAFLFGIEELYAVAGTAVVLIGGARVWVGRQRWDIRVVRHVRPTRVPAGVAARVELAVVNHESRRSPVLAAPATPSTAASAGRASSSPLWTPVRCGGRPTPFPHRGAGCSR